MRDDKEVDLDVLMRFMAAVRYDEQDWQRLIQQVAQGSDIGTEKTALVLEALNDYLQELTQAN